ncbi:hypothetical protein HDU85_002843 [Gaertneriomyces sp. JEL0708]|nr:hypothetical protein HDU85_002843 [Gaertneriomyces sp. JEL0708]
MPEAVGRALGHGRTSSSSLNGYDVDERVMLERAQDWIGPIYSKDGYFQDQHYRRLLLRGVNLAGHSKLPTSPPGSTHLSEGFFDHKNVSFVGRPFALEEADEHFGRLRSWGLTFIRLLVPWESLEHAGPGIYDEEYIDYLITLLAKAKEYGIRCFIDPHQDTWSRFSGGSGAPGWTFETVGLDLTKFMVTGAAYVHQSARPTDSGHAAWPTNYQKLASATMFTIFFGGSIFAPNARYNGEHPQEFLQRHFCACYQHLAERVKHLDTVVGFEVMNEPHFGYIGLKSLHHFDPMKDLHYGDAPSALQSMALASGIPQQVGVWVKSWPWPTRKARTRTINAGGISAWLPGRPCIWRQHGVWDVDANGQPQALASDYFTRRRDGTVVDFGQDCYLPLVRRFKQAILSVRSDYLIFFEPIPNEDPPVLPPADDDPQLIYSPHWYDLKALFNKSFNSFVTHDVQGLSRGTKNVLEATYFGVAGANRNYTGQIRNIVQTGCTKVGRRPILFGECGIPMDMNEKRAFETGDYTHHTIFLDAMINAMEASMVSFTLWNYNPHNDNAHGDHWNGEDFSIFSPRPSQVQNTWGPATRVANMVKEAFTFSHIGSNEDVAVRASGKLTVSASEENLSSTASLDDCDTPTTPFDLTGAYFKEGDRSHHHHVGGRALDAVIRPYAAKIAGDPLYMKFDLKKLEFQLAFTTPDIGASTANDVRVKWSSPAHITEVFVPNFHYHDATVDVIVSDGEWKYERT